MAEKLTTNDNIDQNKMVDKTTVMNFLRDVEEIKAKNSKNSGDMSALMKLAENTGIHKVAFKLAMSLHAMDDDTRSDCLAAFDLYRGYLGLDEYDQGDMFGDNDNANTDEAA